MSALDKTADILIKGGVAVIPTDTVYGLAACPNNTVAIERIFEIKKRPQEKALPILLPSMEFVWNWAVKDSFTLECCAKYWPGANTLILESVSGGSIALRIPNSKITLDLLKLTGPLAATSANISGDATPFRFEDINEKIIKASDFVLESDEKMTGLASTIIDVRANKEIILRQ